MMKVGNPPCRSIIGDETHKKGEFSANVQPDEKGDTTLLLQFSTNSSRLCINISMKAPCIYAPNSISVLRSLGGF